jgi:hypothetical protein
MILFRNSRPMAVRDRQARVLLVSLQILAAITLVAYLCQVTLFGPIRYFLSAVHLEFVWYLPDVLGFICVGGVLLKDGARNIRIVIFLISMALYMVEGYFFSGSVSSVLSTFKALIPFFCGFLLDREVLLRPIVKATIFTLLLAACFGVVESLYVTMPWTNLRFEGIGVFQDFKSMQWTVEGAVRNFGFGGDEHSAASSILTLCILLFSVNARRRVFYPVVAISMVAIYLTTSRTHLACLFVFVFLYFLTDLRGRVCGNVILKWSVRLTSLAILVPVATVVVALVFSVNDVPASLISLWIRGTVTWVEPFRLVDELAPFAMIHGFGLGGTGFGLLQSDMAQYYVPFDNFILFNYLTFGFPYVIFYFYQWRRMLLEQDPYRVIVYVVVMAAGLTLRVWSDYLFMILLGYSMVGVFKDSVLETNKHNARQNMGLRDAFPAPLRRTGLPRWMLK